MYINAYPNVIKRYEIREEVFLHFFNKEYCKQEIEGSLQIIFSKNSRLKYDKQYTVGLFSFIHKNEVGVKRIIDSLSSTYYGDKHLYIKVI